MHEQVQQIIDKWARVRLEIKDNKNFNSVSLAMIDAAWEDFWVIKRLVNQNVEKEENLVLKFRGHSDPVAYDLQEKLRELEKEWTSVEVISTNSLMVSDLLTVIVIVKVSKYV